MRNWRRSSISCSRNTWLERDKLGSLLTLKYHTVIDAAAELGSVDLIRDTFIGFQLQLFSGAQG
jgi:hypothetical protein